MGINKKTVLLVLIVLSCSQLFSQNLGSKNSLKINRIFRDSLSAKIPYSDHFYYLNNLPGLSLSSEGIHIRGGKSFEAGHILEGLNISVDPAQTAVVPLQALKSITLNKNSYSAELGNFSAGLINYEIKPGTEKFNFNLSALSDNFNFNSPADFTAKSKFLGTYSYGNHEINLNIGGPVTERLKYFFNVNYKNYFDGNPVSIESYEDENPDIYIPAGPVSDNEFSNVNLIGRVDYQVTNDIKVNLHTLLNQKKSDYKNNYFTEFLSTRAGELKSNNGFFNFNWDHKLSVYTSYKFQVNYSFTETSLTDPEYGSDFWQYEPQNIISSGSYDFLTESSVLVDHLKTEKERLAIKGIVNYNFSDNIKTRIGIGFEKFLLRKWTSDSQHSYSSSFNASSDENKQQILLQNGVDNYGYDILGDKNDSGLYSPFEPIFFNSFFEIFYEHNELKIIAGLRYDLYNFDKNIFKDPRKPESVFDFNLGQNIKEEGLGSSKDFNYISPRLEIEYRVNDKTSFTAGYGIYYQPQKFEDLYQGLHRSNFIMRYTSYPDYVKLNEPEALKSTRMNLQAMFVLNRHIELNVDLYKSEVKNIIHTFWGLISNSSQYSDYSSAYNSGEYFTKGIEIIVATKPLANFRLLGSLNYFNVKENMRIIYPEIPIGSPINPGPRLFEIEQIGNRNVLEANLALNLYSGKNNTIPFFLKNIDLLLILNYNDGLLLQEPNSNMDYMSEDRTYFFIPKASNISSPVFQTDIMITKEIKFSKKLTGSFFVSVLNLFNSTDYNDDLIKSKIEENELQGEAVSSQAVQQFVANETLRLKKYNYIVQPPRQIKVGFLLEY